MTKPELELKVEELEKQVEEASMKRVDAFSKLQEELSLAKEDNEKLLESIKKQNELITRLEQEKRNLSSANSDNAAKCAKANDEVNKLKAEMHNACEEIKNLKSKLQQPVPDYQALQKEVEIRQQAEIIRTRQLEEMLDFAKNLIDSQAQELAVAKYHLDNVTKIFNAQLEVYKNTFANKKE